MKKPSHRRVRGLFSSLSVLSLTCAGLSLIAAPAANAALDPSLPAPGKAYYGYVQTLALDSTLYNTAYGSMDDTHAGYTYGYAQQQSTFGNAGASADGVVSPNHSLPTDTDATTQDFSSGSAGPTTASGAAGASADGFLSVGTSETSAEAQYVDRDTCVPVGTPLTKSTSTTHDVDFSPQPVPDDPTATATTVDQIGEQTTSSEIRMESNGRTDTDARALVAEATGPVGTYRLLDGAATVTVLTPTKMVARADGLNPTTVDFTAATLRVETADGQTIVLDESHPSVTLSDPNEPSMMMNLTVGSNYRDVTAGGTHVDGSSDTFNAYFFTNMSMQYTGTVVVGSVDAYLDVPAGGVDCAPPPDTDNDGLLDRDEPTYGTNPNVADTDADGLNDGDEVHTYQTNPTKTDTDGDSLSDGDEVNTYHSDPTSTDTDGDSISDGDEVNIYGTEPANSDSDGDGLGDSEEVYTYGTDPTATDTDADGLSDSEEVYTFETNPTNADTDDDGLSDGDEVNTYDSNPLVADTDEDGLNDGAEVTEYQTNPLVPDTDQDSLSDGAEVAQYQTNPLLADTDVDGLDDALEINQYGTDPTKADTDGGSVNDGDEVARGTDPLNGNDDKPVVVNPKADSDGDGLPDTAETQLGTNPYKADTDNDGLTDKQEVTGSANWKYHHRATNPVLADSDRDGLTDGQEVHGMKVHRFKHVRTNPNRADTDGDHLKDGREVHGFLNKRFHKTFKSNPLRKDSDRDGLRDRVEVTGSANGKFHRQPTNPLRKNTDHSSLNDRQEIKAGSNPARAKSTPRHP